MDTGLLPVTAPNWDRSEYNVQYHLIDLSTAVRDSLASAEQEADSERDDIRQLGLSLQTILSKVRILHALARYIACIWTNSGSSLPRCRA